MPAQLEYKRLGWILVFALVTAMAALSYVTGREYLAAVDAVDHARQVESLAHHALTLIVDSETGHRGYLLTGDEAFLEPLVVARGQIDARLTELEGLVSDDPQRRRVRAIRRVATQKIDFIDTTVALMRGGQGDEAIARVAGGRGKRLMDQIRAQARALTEHEERRLVAREREARDAEDVAVLGVAIGFGVILLLAFISIVTVSRDVAELKNAAEELATSEQHYRLLTEQSSDLVRLLGVDGKIRYVSPSVERLLGYTVDEYIATPTLSLLHPSEVDVARGILGDVVSGNKDSGDSTYRILHKDGSYRWFEVRWGAIRNEAGKVHEIHTAGRDVTDRRDAEEKLVRYSEQLHTQSVRDELTGLYNRRGFIEAAEVALAHAKREQRGAAMIFIDLNGMKRINDTLGHEVGDQSLVDAAYVIKNALRGEDVVARLGGDEFVAFVLDAGPALLLPLRVRIRGLCDSRVEELARPYRLSMSVGAAFAEPGADATIDDLLRDADAAMYAQKMARREAGSSTIT